MENQITVRCTRDLYETLSDAAKHYEIKKSKLIRMILEEYQLRIAEVFREDEVDGLKG